MILVKITKILISVMTMMKENLIKIQIRKNITKTNGMDIESLIIIHNKMNIRKWKKPLSN